MAEETKDIFSTLYQINVNDNVEEKNGLKYLSWAYAWKEVRQRYPDATYRIIRNETTNMPYFYDPVCGIECRTEVTICGETHEMWLPVMDSANNPMKFEPYTKKKIDRYGKEKETHVEAATMFDINKTLMRCLTKNLGMFGIGLYIYAGDDLPDNIDEENAKAEISSIMAKIDAEVKRLGSNHTKEEMKAIGDTIVTPIVGSNYRKCTDIDKLKQLFDKISKAS